MQDIKHFLYAWLGRKNIIPEYDIQTLNIKNKQRFKCELRVNGYPYIGAGNSTNKKEAQTNAALDFCQYLVRTGNLNQDDLPQKNKADNNNVSGKNSEIISSGQQLPGGLIAPHQSMGINFNESQQTIEKSSILPYKRGPDPVYMAHLNSIGNRRMVEEAEDTDANSEIHGNWTIDNAKSRLHGFLQQFKINADYKYTSTGQDNAKIFSVLELYASEHGSNKQSASKACALSLTRQLFHYKLIEAFTGEKKKKERPKTDPFIVEVSSELKEQLNKTATIFELNTNLKKASFECVSLVPERKTNLFPLSDKRQGMTISWSPPIENWNAWMGSNIDEGPLASMNSLELSQMLYNDHIHQIKNDTEYKRNLKERSALPVSAFRKQILDAVQKNPVVIIRGATGCGKTTQIPQMLLEDYIESGRGAQCNIYVTQPRRISAVSVSERVAHERNENLGVSTGYSVRFEAILPRCYGGILFCTVGVLLRKLENGLRGISHVVVDEIHERDINTDFLLVLLKDMTLCYPELRIILMSATIDTSLFCEYFGNCPIIEVHGRTFPVQEYFLEDCVQMINFEAQSIKKRKNKNNNNNDEDDEDEVDDDIPDGENEDFNCNTLISSEYSQKTANTMSMLSEKQVSFEIIESLLRYIVSLNQPGAVLIFMPGWNLICSLLKHLRETFFGSSQFVLLPLHSQIAREEQYKVFEEPPPGKTKIIVSTNIAESSITINDVVYVIDSCKVKQKIFTSRNNMTNYATVWASKANLDQRKGRAGRVKAGYCFRLISRARYERLENHATPEIFRTPLLDLALSIKLLRLGEIKDFLTRAIEPPPLDAVAEAEVALKEMNAFDLNGELTPLGTILARLPIEPRLGKMIIMGCIFEVGDAVCTIAAASTFPEPFLHDGRTLRIMHKSMSGRRCSDHTALLVAFQMWLRAKWQGEDAEIELCERKCLNMQTMRMTFEARNQLKDIMMMSGFPEKCLAEVGFNQNETDHRLDVIGSLLTYALYPNVCFHTDKRKLITSDGKQALINKNSVNCSKEIVTFPYPFFVFGEKIKTRAVSAKQMTMVTPLQLLLFGSEKIETVPNEPSIICLDNWINLKMETDLAATIVAHRQAMDSVLVDCTMQPSLIESRPLNIQNFIKTLFMLSDQNNSHINCTRDKTQGYSNLNSADGSLEPDQKRINSGADDFSSFNTNDNNMSNYNNMGTSYNHRGGFMSGGYNRGSFGNVGNVFRGNGGGFRGNNRGFRGGGFSGNNYRGRGGKFSGDGGYKQGFK